MRDKVRDKKVRVKKKGKNKASPWEERREGGKKTGNRGEPAMRCCHAGYMGT